MTTEQLAQALLVAIATAFATAVLNNFFELRRLQSMWKRETDDRVAHYRRQRLEDKLNIVQGHASRYLDAMDLFEMHPTDETRREEVRRALSDVRRGFGFMRAMALSTADLQLLEEVKNLHWAMDDIFPNGTLFEDMTEDQLWELRNGLVNRASLVIKRCDKLLDEADYA